jgi:hypothetical protein
MRPPFIAANDKPPEAQVRTLCRYTAKLDCGGKQHYVVHTKRGRLKLVHHSRADVRARLAAVALGAEPCACIKVLVAWRQHCKSFDGRTAFYGAGWGGEHPLWNFDAITSNARDRHSCRVRERTVYTQTLAWRLHLHKELEAMSCLGKLRRARSRAIIAQYSGAAPGECPECLRALVSQKYSIGCDAHKLSPVVNNP